MVGRKPFFTRLRSQFYSNLEAASWGERGSCPWDLSRRIIVVIPVIFVRLSWLAGCSRQLFRRGSFPKSLTVISGASVRGMRVYLPPNRTETSGDIKRFDVTKQSRLNMDEQRREWIGPAERRWTINRLRRQHRDEANRSESAAARCDTAPQKEGLPAVESIGHAHTRTESDYDFPSPFARRPPDIASTFSQFSFVCLSRWRSSQRNC